MAIRYSRTVLDHFMTPRNVGEIADADGVGEVGNPTCGDIMTFYIKVKDNRLEEIKFKTFGCGAAIAVSSMISEMAMNKTLDEALQITNKDVAQELEGLPATKMHCSNLGADALHAAIKSYQQRLATGATMPEKVIIDDQDEHEREEGEEERVHAGSLCRCPFCSVETPAAEPLCHACGRKLNLSQA